MGEGNISVSLALSRITMNNPVPDHPVSISVRLFAHPADYYREVDYALAHILAQLAVDMDNVPVKLFVLELD